MNQNEIRIWELLAKKICGEATQQDIVELNALLDSQTHTRTQKILEVLQNYWQNLRDASDNSDIKAKSELFLSKVSFELHSDKPFEDFYISHKSSFIQRNWWKIAAMIVVLIGAGYLIYKSNFTTPKTIEIALDNGTRKELTLPDGTKVWLNSGSTISYSEQYLKSEKREVSLIGEAYFDVKHNSAHPFVIHTNYGISIQDIGTIFNVKAYPKDSSMETTLLQGSVEVYQECSPTQKLLLKPKQKFVYFLKTHQPSISDKIDESTDNNSVSIGTIGEDKFAIAKIAPVLNKEGDSLVSETAWIQNQLAFVSETFSQLANEMSRWYSININIKDTTVANYKFTGVFEGETVTQALDELQLIRPFHYNIDKKGNIEITR